MKTKVYGEGSRRQSFPVIFGTVVLLALGLLLLSGTGAQADSETNAFSTWMDTTADWSVSDANWTNVSRTTVYTNAPNYNGPLGTNYIVGYSAVVPPAQLPLKSVVYITNSSGGYTVSYNTALYTNNATALRALIITNGIGTVNRLDVNNRLSIDTAGWVGGTGGSGGGSNWFSPLFVHGEVWVNSGGWLDVNGTNVNASASTATIGGRNAAGGLIVVNGGTLSINGRATTVTDIGAGGNANNNSGSAVILSNGWLSIMNPRIGRYGGSNGKIEIFDGTAFIGIYSGDNSSGNVGTNWDTSGLIVHGGSLSVTGSITLGSRGWSTMYVTGGSVSNTGTGFDLGWLGGISTSAVAKTGGRYIQTGGTTVVTVANIRLGIVSNNIGEVTVSGGLLDAYGVVLNPSAGMGVQASFTVTNTGQAYLSGGGLVAYSNTYTTNTVTLGDSAVLGAKETWSDYYGIGAGVGTITLASGTPTIRAANPLGVAKNITLSGTIVGDGGLIKDGGGKLTLSPGSNTVNTYTGPTTINSGTLLVNGVHSNGGNYAVNAGGTLGGTGIINLAVGNTVTVNDGATLSPGMSPGLLTLNSSLDLRSNSTYLVEVNGAGAASYDSILVTSGTISLSNAVLTLALNYDPTFGDAWTIIYNDAGQAVLGTFAGQPEGNIFYMQDPDWNDVYVQITYAGGPLSQNVVLSVIPEPSALALAGLGLLGAYLVRRRTRK